MSRNAAEQTASDSRPDCKRCCLWRIDMLSDSIRDRCPSEASGTCGAHPAAVKRSDQPTAPRLPCLWRIDMLSDSIRDRCPSEASGACGAHPAAVKRSDQPTAPRLPAQTATGSLAVQFVDVRWILRGARVLGESGSPWCVIEASTVALPSIGMEIGDGSRRRCVLGQVFALPGQYASDDG